MTDVAHSLTADEVACLKYAGGEGARGAAIGTNWFRLPLRLRVKETHRARRVLKALERKGLMRGVAACNSGRVYWWLITDAGRAAI